MHKSDTACIYVFLAKNQSNANAMVASLDEFEFETTATSQRSLLLPSLHYAIPELHFLAQVLPHPYNAHTPLTARLLHVHQCKSSSIWTRLRWASHAAPTSGKLTSRKFQFQKQWVCRRRPYASIPTIIEAGSVCKLGAGVAYQVYSWEVECGGSWPPAKWWVDSGWDGSGTVGLGGSRRWGWVRWALCITG